MADLTVSVDGSRELRGALRELADKGLLKALSQANKAAAQVVVDAAAPAVPTRSGRLRRTLRAAGSQTRGSARIGGNSAPYAAAIHYGRKVGNVGSPPGNHPGRNLIVGRPFLTTAATRAQTRVVTEYEQAIDELLERALHA